MACPLPSTGGGGSTPLTTEEYSWFNALALSVVITESSGTWDAVGPNLYGECALGVAQVMSNNVPEWSRRHLGFEITPLQFIRSKEYQVKIINGEFTRIWSSVQGYPTLKEKVRAAAAIWFSGRPYCKDDYNLNSSCSDGYTAGGTYADLAWDHFSELPYEAQDNPTVPLTNIESNGTVSDHGDRPGCADNPAIGSTAVCVAAPNGCGYAAKVTVKQDWGYAEPSTGVFTTFIGRDGQLFFYPEECWNFAEYDPCTRFKAPEIGLYAYPDTGTVNGRAMDGRNASAEWRVTRGDTSGIHLGVDVARVSEPYDLWKVASPVKGKVILVSQTAMTGHIIKVRTTGGITVGELDYQFEHLMNPAVAVGDDVEVGDLLGLIADRDNMGSLSSGPHLHLSVLRVSTGLSLSSSLYEGEGIKACALLNSRESGQANPPTGNNSVQVSVRSSGPFYSLPPTAYDERVYPVTATINEWIDLTRESNRNWLRYHPDMVLMLNNLEQQFLGYGLLFVPDDHITRDDADTISKFYIGYSYGTLGVTPFRGKIRFTWMPRRDVYIEPSESTKPPEPAAPAPYSEIWHYWPK